MARSAAFDPNRNTEELVFQLAMYWRIGLGALRMIIGYKLLSLIGQPAIQVYRHMFRSELYDDPENRLLQFVSHTLTNHGFAITYFLAAHFLFWGIIDICLSIAMIRHKLWAFMTSIFFVVLFICYEVVRFTHTHSLLLLAFICSDFIFIYLIRHEYNRLKERAALRLEKRVDNRKTSDSHNPHSDPTD